MTIEGFGAHSLRATAATNALDHEADIAKMQEWLGHVSCKPKLDFKKGRVGVVVPSTS